MTRYENPTPIRRRRVTTRDLASEVRDQIATDLLLSGEIAIGETLPSEAAIAASYGVSRATVRTALRMLQDAEFIQIRSGIGSVVLPRPAIVDEGFDQLSSLDTYARASGQAIETADVELREEAADELAASKLNVPLGTPLVVAQRSKLLRGRPIAWGIERAPATVIARDVLEAKFAGAMMDVLLDDTRLAVEHADAEFAAVAAPPDIAARLEVETGTVTQYLEHVMYAWDGTAVQWAESWLLPDSYRFRVRRRVARVAPPYRR